MTDSEALKAYVLTASNAAFTDLVRRHVDVVYSAALRQTRQTHLAEDATQAVFMVLARKARTIHDPAVLPGWLVRAARYSAMNALKLEARRRRHEQRAAAMAPTSFASESSCEQGDIKCTLDRHLSKLGETDRSAVVLRFLHGKSVREVSVDLNVSEEAAQKRIRRAIAKLRTMFAGDGIVTAGEAFERALGAQTLHAAPAALMSLITASALGGTAAGGISGASVVAKAVCKTMFWTHAKLITGAAAVLLIAGGTAVVLESPPTARADSPRAAAANTPAAIAPPVTQPAIVPVRPASAPSKFPNHIMGLLQPNNEEFAHTIDQGVRRTTEPAALLQSLVPTPKARAGGEHFVVAIDQYHGRRIRVTGWIKTQDVVGWAGLDVNVISAEARIFAHDDMGARPIHGTNDWKQYASVVDVPQGANQLIMGVSLYSTGKVWSDGFEVTVVGNDVPITDDQNWHTFSWNARGYSAKPDPTVPRNGHPTTCFSSTADFRPADWGIYDAGDRHIDAYLGKKIRMTAWLKSEGVSQGSGLSIHVNGGGYKQLTNDGQKGKRPVRGTMDWRKYEAIADVPLDAQAIFCGVTMNGKGKIWIDDVQLEVINEPAGK
jgi:RNA polymerase sigma factor (sigma-70 family)